MSQALSRKWRPARFGDVIGQEHITRTLQNAIKAGRIGQAYLFCGPRGTGKTTSARLLAKAVDCLHPDPAQRPCNQCGVCRAVNEGRFLDLIEIDAASNTGVDDIRDLRDKINFAPTEGRYKVYIIDEVHMLSTAAFNALLKTLEEPPPHAIFVLATTEEHKVPLTIKSRCQQFNFRLLTQVEIARRLEWLAAQEALEIEPAALTLIAREGAGSLRDAESLLDQLVTTPGERITLERAQMVLGTASDQTVLEMAEAWLAADAATGLRTLQAALAAGADARQFCRQMVTHLRQVLLLQAAGNQLTLDIPLEQLAALQAQAQRVERPALIAAIRLYSQAATVSGSGRQPQLPLELAFLESLPATAAHPAWLPPREPTTPLPTSAPVTAPPAAPPEMVVTTVSAESPLPPPAPTPILKPAALSLDSVVAQWRNLPGLVRQRDRNLSSLLAMIKPLGVDGKTIILGFDFPVLKEKFDAQADAPRIVAEALQQLLGSPCLVRSVITSQHRPDTAVSRADVEALAQELGGVVQDTE